MKTIHAARILCIVLLGLIVTLTISGNMLEAAKVRRFVIATAGTAGALYPMGVAMAQTITKHSQTFAASAESSAASVENLRNLHEGKVEWGISQSEIATFAYNGEGPFKGREMKDLRALFGTVGSWVQIFAPAKSSLKSVGDFKGKRIGVGQPGSGGEMDARIILSWYGISYEDIHEVFMSDAEMVEALRDGSLDAFISTHPLKSAAMLDLTTSFDVKMISVADEEFYKSHRYFQKRVIPKGTYRNVEYDVTTPYSRVIMYTTTNAKFSEDDIYHLLTIIWDNRSEWKGAHAAVDRDVTLERALDGIATPLHPGAVKFYREKGFNIPEEIIPPEVK